MSSNSHNKSASSSTNSILTAAEEATRRAEQFLKQQTEQSIQSVPSEDDSVMEQARAAARMAQEQMNHNHGSNNHNNNNNNNSSQNSSTGFFTTRIGELFRPKNGDNNNNGSHSTPSQYLKKTSTGSSLGSDHSSHRLPPTKLQHQQQPLPPRSVVVTQSKDNKGLGSFVPPSSSAVMTELERATSAPFNLQPSSVPLTTLPQQHPTVMIVQKTEPVAQPTPSQLFEKMIRDFRNKVVTSMTEITRLRQERAGLLEERLVTMAKERLAAQQQEVTLVQQQLAAEQEDFELAEQLQSVLEQHDRERSELAAVMEAIAKSLNAVEQKKKRVIDNGVTKEFTLIQKKLKAFLKEQENMETNNAAAGATKFATVAKQLSAEQERLSHDLKHLERDAKLVAEERKELEAAISEQTSEIETMRDEAKGKLVTVEEEIEELRKQLAAKQKIAAQLRTEAAGHEESILKVRVKFARQLTRVQRKEMSAKDAREEWETEKQSFDRNKEDHDRQVREHSELLLEQEQLLESLGKELDLAETFGEIVAKEIGLGMLPNDEDELNGDLAQMHTEVVKCEAAVSEAKLVLKSTSSTLSSMENEIETLETRIPILEETKKQCATKRDFKGAGVASKEIKDATSRVKECHDAIDEVRERNLSAQTNLKQLEEELAEKRRVAQEQEREAGMATMDQLADTIKSLLATKASVCDNAKELSVKGVGAYVIQSQILALRQEGHSYGEKYGGWDKRMAELGVTDDEEAETEKAVAPVDSDVTAGSSKGDDKVKDTGPANKETLEEKQARYRALASRLSQVESGIEAAAEAEDFEKAAVMQDELEKLLVDLENLDLTDEEMEAALANKDKPEPASVSDDHDAGDEAADDAPVEPENEVVDEVPVEPENEVADEAPVESEDEVADEAPDEPENEVVDEVPVESEDEIANKVPAVEPENEIADKVPAVEPEKALAMQEATAAPDDYDDANPDSIEDEPVDDRDEGKEEKEDPPETDSANSKVAVPVDETIPVDEEELDDSL
jgi:hypothetical protein